MRKVLFSALVLVLVAVAGAHGGNWADKAKAIGCCPELPPRVAVVESVGIRHQPRRDEDRDRFEERIELLEEQMRIIKDALEIQQKLMRQIFERLDD